MRFILSLLCCIFANQLIGQTIGNESFAEMAKHHRIADLERVFSNPRSYWKDALEAETGYNQVTPLFYAVDYAYGPHDSNAVATIKMLMKAGANLRYEDKYKTSILHLAAEGGMDWLVRECLKAKCDPNQVSQICGTPLMAAFIQPREPVIQLLVDAGTKPNWVNEYGTTYLHQAARNKLEKWIKWQLDNGGNMLQKENTGLCAAEFYVNAGGANPATLSTFAKKGIDLSNIILRAITVGNTAFLQYLKDEDIPIEQHPAHRVVEYAAGNGRTKALKWLLSNGFSPNPSSEGQVSPLWSATLARDTACIRLLLNAGAQANEKNQHGQNVLFAFPDYDPIMLDREEMKRSMPRRKPSPVPTLELLVNAGADLHAQDAEGKTPYDAAMKHLSDIGEHRLWYAPELRAFFKKHGFGE